MYGRGYCVRSIIGCMVLGTGYRIWKTSIVLYGLQDIGNGYRGQDTYVRV
jgi:hypothetical protein